MKRSLILALVALVLASAGRAADEPVYAVKNTNAPPLDLAKAIHERIKPLKNDRGRRWPMILWECLSFDPQPLETNRMLLERGLVQHVRMDDKMIPTAKAIQEAGGPVIMMEGAGGPWPASLAGDAAKWAHQFEPGYSPGEGAKPCLALHHEGWAINADRVRGILRKYEEAGVTVNAVWLDWEGDPLGPQYEQARHCVRCKAMLPAGVLANPDNCRRYNWRLYTGLLDAYLAAPVREVFPTCSIANWMICYSTPDRPARFWGDSLLMPAIPAFFTHSNPIVYGNTVHWKQWNPAWPLDREHVDQFYFQLLLRMVSDDAANRLRWAPDKRGVPWVARWCPDDEDPKIPLMSRERYREVLRHIWLRGTDAMQVFNATRRGYEDIVFAEVEDAVSVYDEMLAYREFLDAGEVMCTDSPGVQDSGAVWSGLRLEDRAVVRVFKQGGDTSEVKIEPWPGQAVSLAARPEGRTFIVVSKGGKAAVEQEWR